MDSISLYTKTLRALDLEVETLQDYILDGAPATEVEYHKAVSRRAGLLQARGILEELFRRADSEDEHDV